MLADAVAGKRQPPHPFLIVQRALDFLDLEALDNIALAHIIVVGKGHSALLTGRYLLDLVLEALERRQRAFVNDNVVADQAYFGTTLDAAISDETTCDLADLRDVKDFPDFSVAEEDFPKGWIKHAGHGLLHIINEIVNDIVVTDLDTITVRCGLRLHVGTYVEADHNRIRGGSKRNIRFRDATNGRMHESRLNLVGRQLAKRAGDGFDRTLHIAFNDERKLLVAVLTKLRHHLFERTSGSS